VKGMRREGARATTRTYRCAGGALNAGGASPSSLVLHSRTYVMRVRRAATSGGRVPDSRLSPRYSAVSVDDFPSDAGIVPVSWFPPR
jgi:hypothetical protein